MKMAAVTDVKNRLSHYLRLVARGESVTITDHGQPIARLSAVEPGSAGVDGLVATGLARPPVAPLPGDFLTRPLVTPGARRALLEDRDDRF